MGEPVSPDDVYRLAAEGPPPSCRARRRDGKIVLPGLRRAIVPKTQGQRDYLQAITNHDIVVGIGPAGTGKTYLAVAKAVEALARKRVRRIILARPAVEAGESLGFLPGDLQAKVDPYLRPLYDALEDMMPHDRVQRALETRTIEIAPLAYMRGRTLADAFIILDEAQNATGAQMKMFLTRLGVNSRTVVTGDKTQIDLPRREDSGLVQVERVLPGIEGIAFCYLHETDVVRHRLVREIIGPTRRIRTADAPSGAVPARRPPGEALPDRIGFHLVRWVPLLVTALVAYALFPPPAGALAALPVGRPGGRPHGRGAVRRIQVRKTTEEMAREGESAGARRPAGLSASAPPPTIPRSPPRAHSSPTSSAPRRRDPSCCGPVAATPGAPRAGRDRATSPTPRSGRRMQELVTHFLGESALARGGRRGRRPGRAEPPDHPPPGRHRAGAGARFHPDLRRPDGAGGGRRHRGRGPGGPAHAAAARRRVLPADDRARPAAHDGAAGAAPRRAWTRSSTAWGRASVLTSAGQPVTEEARAKLAVLQQEIVRRGAEHLRLRAAIGVLLHNALLLAAFWLLVAFYRRETYQHAREMAFFGALFSLVLLLTAGLHAVFPGGPSWCRYPSRSS